MYRKLVYRALRDNKRDYSLYILTLSLAVSLFYSFNSFDTQGDLLVVPNSNHYLSLATISGIMLSISLIVTAVFIFLIGYANHYLITLRRHEFAIYLTLGMNNKQAFGILALTTALVAALSLSIGLIIGAVISHILTYVTALLFHTTLSVSQISFSFLSFAVTLLSFTIIFTISTLVQFFSITRSQPRTLFRSNINTPSAFTPHTLLTSTILFTLSILIFLFSFFLTHHIHHSFVYTPFVFLSLIAALFLFFRSLLPLTLHIVRRLPTRYLKHLGPFTSHQSLPTSRRTAFNLSIITFSLIATFSVMIIGGNTANYFRSISPHMTSFDVSFDSYPNKVAEHYTQSTSVSSPNIHNENYQRLTEYKADMKQALKETIPAWDNFIASSFQIDIYDIPQCSLGSILPAPLPHDMEAQQQCTAISLSDFNTIAAATHTSPLSLPAQTFAFNHTSPIHSRYAQKIEAHQARLTLGSSTLTYSGKLENLELHTHSYLPDSYFLVIVPDIYVHTWELRGVLPAHSIVNATYTMAPNDGDTALYEALGETYNDYHDFDYTYQNYWGWPLNDIYTTDEVNLDLEIIYGSLTFASLYIALTFLITLTAVISIQFISRISRNRREYHTLSQLGADETMLNRSILTQNTLHFLVPLIVAGVLVWAYILSAHTLLDYAYDSVLTLYSLSFITGFVLLYLVYMFATYEAAKGLVSRILRNNHTAHVN